MEFRDQRIKNSNFNHQNHVGLYIALFISDKHLTVYQAAKLAGINTGTFRRIITGEYNMGIITFFKMADFMASKSIYEAAFFMNRLKQEIEKGALNEQK